MKKKGQSEVLTTTLLFELLIGVLIAGTLMYAVLNLNNTSRASKEYMQQDLMLVKEMARSLPGDLDMVYNTSSWCLTEDEKFGRGTNCGVRVVKKGDEVTVEKVKVEEDEKRGI